MFVWAQSQRYPAHIQNPRHTFPLAQKLKNSKSGGKSIHLPPNPHHPRNMPRRRLRLSSYSDDEHEPENENGDINSNINEFHSTHQQAPNLNLTTDQPRQVPIPIPDDEFVDANETFSPPSPPHAPPLVSSGCPVGDFLLRLGLSLRREWLDCFLRGLNVRGFHGDDVAEKAKLCFEQFLVTDMNDCGNGVLPPNVDSMHLVDLAGPFVLQVDEGVNISCPLKGRYQDAPCGVKRCLKLSMTDGVQRVFAMEYRPIKDLKVLAPAGFKVAICNVQVRHGLLMLVPEALEVLGGMVEELNAARQRFVHEVNKPPRGRRSRTGVVPPLATRATLAAWPENGVNVPARTSGFGNILGDSNDSANLPQNDNGSANMVQQSNGSVNARGRVDSSPSQCPMPFQSEDRGTNFVPPHIETNQSTAEACAVPSSTEDALSHSLSGVVSDVEQMHIDAPSLSREATLPSNNSNAILEDHDGAHMVDEFEHPLILAGDREIPFTYLASLSAKWAATKEKSPSVQGKIKCFLTGVKGFKYKQRKTYELQVYVDDGSLICEILIDHNVVQKGIGHSPEEVTAALSSSDKMRVGDMKETLRRFQIFLANFEGTMVVEMNGSSLPVALGMTQGCLASDAQLLARRLERLKSPQHPSLDPIEISP